jgi:aminoglycoside phosphotransferase family enzyme
VKEVTLAEKVSFLRRPESYPEPTTGVDAIETHMSWVFLTDEHAYKLKKPVRFKLLKLATLADRKRNCDEEVHWNQRLAAGVYLGVVPLGVGANGRLALGEVSKVVDWLVKMRRLPAEKMLERAIASGRLDRADLRPAAEALARFYSRAPRVDIREDEYRLRFTRDIEEILHELQAVSAIPRARIQAVASDLTNFVDRRAGLLDARVREGRIREVHGDLRPEHVCLVTPPVIIDCLEFAPELRRLDPADELSFLAVESGLAGGPPFIEEVFFGAYFELTSDRPPQALVRFYKSFRAFLRAKITIWHLNDPDVKDTAKWLDRAGRYLEAAAHSGCSS